MDATQLYSSTLEQLNQAIITMTSPEWDEKTQAAPAAQRQQSLNALLRVQHARLALGNAVLQNIAGDLKANEQRLTDAQQALDAAFNTLGTVQSAIKAVTSLLNVIAKIVPLV